MILFRNPIIPGFYPDPSVCRVGKDYYLVTSTFEYFPAIPVFHSRDLVHWRQIGHAVSRPGLLNLDHATNLGGIYAPTIRYHDGWFYIACTNVTTGGHFIVKTQNPQVEWSNPVWVRTDPKPDFTMDPSLFFDEDGGVYFTYYSPAGIMQAVLDLETGEFLHPARLIATSMLGKSPEGPHLYKINGMYYLMLAEGGTEFGHMEVIARSKSPWGPFDVCPHNPILTHRSLDHPLQMAGHGDLVQAEDGSWWLFCLAVRPHGYQPCHHLGRETCLAPVKWMDDGWPQVGRKGVVDLEMAGPLPPAVPWEIEPDRDDFDLPNLGMSWVYVRNPQPGSWSLAERTGFLRLHGLPGSLDQLTPLAFLGRRQRHFVVEISARMEFLPTAENEEAGLAIRMNEGHHYKIFLSLRNKLTCLVGQRRIGSLVSEVATLPVDPGPVTLVIRADYNWYSMGFLENEVFSELARGETRYLSTEVARGFTGVVIGMYASGNGQSCTNPADFDWFEYKSGEE
jgi:xylan 1,4-beta-xylosidase